MVAPELLNTSENVTAINFVNHDEVLPEADLLVTHAGHGTVAAGLKYGVPMLCIPFGRDQDLNADRVATLGLGRVLDPDSETEVLLRAVRDILKNNALQKRAKDFSDSLQDHPGIEEAVTAIDDTINSSQPS
jgi:UDP:flavonoid glycosyltransferase YjiC (YdhE family)